MKIMFSAGEASGDLHGANLARALKQLAPDIELLGMGGERMKDAGVDIVYDIANLGVIGIGEIIRKIPFFFRLRDFSGRYDEKRTARRPPLHRLSGL